ncbi:hypothetical protein B0H16DRAFT_1701592 [Mycena metata]|uniref:Uncharacterized protein n=1 Tax=Mycena metata TaxID=1033252 RepID=A0AAD7HA56_9AGAR|nr:hypothetical protein B0H16DRAFT_1701592 [Mycena metata]
MEEILQVLQGTTVAPTRPPAFVKLAPSDNGQSLPAVFFERESDTVALALPFTNHNSDPQIRKLYPPPSKRGAGHEDVPYLMMRKMMHQMTYAPLNRDTKLVRPEDQFMSGVLARRKLQLKQVNLGEDRIWRRFIVSGGMSLGVLQDKVLAPLMGWVRNFHAHILTDYCDGTQYGPKNSTAIDMMHIDAACSGCGILPVYKALSKYTIVPGPSRILSAELTVAFAAHAAVEPKEH